MIELQYEACYVPDLTKELCIIYTQGICTSAVHKVTFIYYYLDDHDSYGEINLRKENLDLTEG